MSDLFTPIITIKSQLVSDVPVVNGQFIVTSDTLEVYIDSDSKRKKYSDVVIGTYASLTSDLAPLTDKLYFATDTHQLLQAYYENSTLKWKVLNEYQSEIVNITASGDVTQTLEDNTLYYISGTIGAINLSVSSTMSYCTVCFTASASTTFTHITGSRAIGFDCSGGIFTPVAGKEYQIAIDKLNNILTLYVLRID